MYAETLKGLTLSNDAIWAREDARPSVPAPLVIRVPYLVLCGVLDTLYDGRPIARFWYLETVSPLAPARPPARPAGPALAQPHLPLLGL